MAQSKIPPARKKKIKIILSMMNKQNQRFVPVVPPLIEMMDLVITDDELDYLLKMGIGNYDYDQAAIASSLPDEQFESFFETIKRKALVHIGSDSYGRPEYRLNAIAAGWYEGVTLYLMGKPEEKDFSLKLDGFFKFFQKFNFFPLNSLQNLFIRPFVKPGQDAVLMDPAIKGKSKTKTIPISTVVSSPNSKVYPTFYVNELIEEHGDHDNIYVFPCVCRHSKDLLGTPCSFEIPRESCIAFGDMANAWASWGYGRKNFQRGSL